MNDSLSVVETLLRMVLAVLGAGALGWERECHKKPAGLRTQMMVGLGAAAFTLLSVQFHYASLEAGAPQQVDMLRTIAGIIGGIGFLGAGTIIRSSGSVTGITTASTIWVVGAYGIACGVGFYVLAGITLVLALVILVAFGRLERWLPGGPSHEDPGPTALPPESTEPM